MKLIGFEKDGGTRDLLCEHGLYPDYRAMLPDHLLGILRQQHPSVVIESIELLGAPKCHLGGVMEEGSTIMKVQTLDVPLDLRVIVHVGDTYLALDVQLVLKFEGLDATRTIRSDLLIKAQTRMS